MAPECQEKNLKGLTMVAIGMNKAADEFLILDERTREELAGGKYRDQRRGLFGPQAPAPGPSVVPGGSKPPALKARRPRKSAQPAARTSVRPQWTRSQEKLALLYNEQGVRPADIAAKLGVSSHLVTQIILAARNRGKA